MKLVKIPNKKEHILTPWLSTDEAAVFLGVSRETFRRLQREVLPCPVTGGDANNRRYLVAVLSEWWQSVAHLSFDSPRQEK